MSSKVKVSIVVAVAALLAASICGLVGSTIYAIRLPEQIGGQDTLILGQSHLIPGAPGTIHVQVRRHDSGAPVADAEVKVLLQPHGGRHAELLFTGATDADGQVSATFTVPDMTEVDQRIIVETESRLGRDRLEQPVTVERSYKVLLTTDKPIYQPGQQILVGLQVIVQKRDDPIREGRIKLGNIDLT